MAATSRGAGYFSSPYYHGFLYNGSTVIDLGTLGGNYSDAFGVSSNGLVTGQAQDSSGNYQAYYTDANGTMHQIAAVPAGSTGYGINSSGQVAGSSGDGTPFLYSGGVASNVNTLLATSGWTVTTVLRINDAGQMLAQAQNASTGQSHAVLLTPFDASAVPEPASIGLFTIGSLGLFLISRKRK